MAPANPAAIAAQRRKPTCSPRKAAAPAVANNGATKDGAVAAASGIRVTAVNQHNMAPMPERARKAMDQRPVRAQTGAPPGEKPGNHEREPEQVTEKDDLEGVQPTRYVADEDRDAGKAGAREEDPQGPPKRIGNAGVDRRRGIGFRNDASRCRRCGGGAIRRGGARASLPVAKGFCYSFPAMSLREGNRRP